NEFDLGFWRRSKHLFNNRCSQTRITKEGATHLPTRNPSDVHGDQSQDRRGRSTVLGDPGNLTTRQLGILQKALPDGRAIGSLQRHSLRHTARTRHTFALRHSELPHPFMNVAHPSVFLRPTRMRLVIGEFCVSHWFQFLSLEKSVNQRFQRHLQVSGNQGESDSSTRSFLLHEHNLRLEGGGAS